VSLRIKGRLPLRCLMPRAAASFEMIAIRTMLGTCPGAGYHSSTPGCKHLLTFGTSLDRRRFGLSPQGILGLLPTVRGAKLSSTTNNWLFASTAPLIRVDETPPFLVRSVATLIRAEACHIPLGPEFRLTPLASSWPRTRGGNSEDGAYLTGQPWRTSALLWWDFTLAHPASGRASRC
jgi:hypothetical protein